jgi:hypothetical protein
LRGTFPTTVVWTVVNEPKDQEEGTVLEKAVLFIEHIKAISDYVVFTVRKVLQWVYETLKTISSTLEEAFRKAGSISLPACPVPTPLDIYGSRRKELFEQKPTGYDGIDMSRVEVDGVNVFYSGNLVQFDENGNLVGTIDGIPKRIEDYWELIEYDKIPAPIPQGWLNAFSKRSQFYYLKYGKNRIEFLDSGYLLSDKPTGDLLLFNDPFYVMDLIVRKESPTTSGAELTAMDTDVELEMINELGDFSIENLYDPSFARANAVVQYRLLEAMQSMLSCL